MYNRNYDEYNQKYKDDNIYKFYNYNNLYINTEDEKVKESNNIYHNSNNINSNNEFNIKNTNTNTNTNANTNINTNTNTPKNPNLKIQRNLSYTKTIRRKQSIPIEIIDIEKNNYTKKNKGINYEKIVKDIINITNKYNKDSNININNIIDEYELLLRNKHIKEKFISKLINDYNNLNNLHLTYDDSNSLTSIYKWIKQNNFNSNKYNEQIQYVQFCQDIMRTYNLNDIQSLKEFINKLLKKVDNNDNFLEGIKKILSV